MKHEPDCGCLTCYQALRKFRDDAKALAEKWNMWGGYSSDDFENGKCVAFERCAEDLEKLIAASEKRDA